MNLSKEQFQIAAMIDSNFTHPYYRITLAAGVSKMSVANPFFKQ